MKIPQKRKSNKKYLVLLATIIVLAGLAGAAYALHIGPFVKIDQNSTLSNNTDKNSKDPTITDTTAKTASTADSSATTTDQVPKSATIAANITELIQQKDQILFTGTVTGTTSNGTCVITFTNPNDKPVVKTIQSSLKDGTVICGEISVPTLEFSYLGTWNVNLRFYINDTQATTDKTINIQ